MASSKEDLFESKDRHLALLCKALSHPARINIIRNLISNERTYFQFHEITRGLPLVKSTLSQHIKYLIDMNVVRSKKSENKIYYYLNSNLQSSYIEIIFLVWSTNHEKSSELQKEIEKLRKWL